MGVFAVRMEWGDEIELPPDTDGGAIERDEVTVSYLSRIVAEPRADLGGVDEGLDGLLQGLPSTLAAMIPARREASDARLREYRASIDNIDAALVHLLAERFKITQAVGRYKADVGLPPADPAREAQQVARLRTLAVESGLDPAFTEKFLRFIVDEVILHHRRIADEPDRPASAAAPDVRKRRRRGRRRRATSAAAAVSARPELDDEGDAVVDRACAARWRRPRCTCRR